MATNEKGTLKLGLKLEGHIVAIEIIPFSKLDKLYLEVICSFEIMFRKILLDNLFQIWP